MVNHSKLSSYVKFDCIWKSRETVIKQADDPNHHQIYFCPINFENGFTWLLQENYSQR